MVTMEKIKLVLSLVVILNVVLFSQRTLPTEDNFNYSLGNLQNTYPASNWLRISSSGDNDLNVVSGNLIFSGYPMPAAGSRIQLLNGFGDDFKLEFNSQVAGKIYASFLLNISDSIGTGINPNDVFSGLGSGTGFANARIIRRNGSIPGTNYNLGLCKSSTLVLGWSGDLLFNATYLVVVCYEFISGGTSNDIVKLWVNPDLSGNEPSPIISGVNSTADNNIIDGFWIRQNSGTPNAYIDGLRIGTSWSDSPLPVELSSFSASTIGSTVKLIWRTEAEVNNYGFDVERSETQDARGEMWKKIGFVNGNGNSNLPKDYSFEDKSVTAGKHSYRLKQIDNDGQFEYSKTIEVDFGTPKKFELSQNYPNPFNPTTIIRFNLPETGIAKLILYDVLGQEVRILLNENKAAGVYTLQLDASELNSGMYIYKLESGSNVQTRKMILIK